MNEKPTLTENKEAIKRVSPKEALELLKSEQIFYLAMTAYILGLESREEGSNKYTEEEIRDLKATIEEILMARNVYLKPSEGVEDVFTTFVNLIRYRSIPTA